MPLGLQSNWFGSTTSSTQATAVPDASQIEFEPRHEERFAHSPVESGLQGRTDTNNDMKSENLETEGRPPYLHVSIHWIIDTNSFSTIDISIDTGTIIPANKLNRQ